METFSAVDLQKRTGDVQRAAARDPVVISVHGRPRNVMLSFEEFERLRGAAASEIEPVAGPEKINRHFHRFPPHLAREIQARSAVAIQRAGKALAALELLGIKAWVIGSLARGTFTHNSDVDFMVDVPSTKRRLAQLILEETMKDFPFDMVTFDRVDQDALPLFMEGALDASGLRSRFA